MKCTTLAIALAGSAALGLGARVTPAPLSPSAPPAPATAGSYAIDPVHSAMIFKIGHNSGTFFGRFNKIAGSFLLESSGSVDFTVETASIDSANEKRDQDLKGPDFFNIKQFPTSTFKSTSIKSTGTGSYEVAGDLTLNGTTKPITVKISSAQTGINAMNKKENAGFEAVATLKRADFGITKYPGMLGDEVTVMVGIEGNR